MSRAWFVDCVVATEWIIQHLPSCESGDPLSAGDSCLPNDSQRRLSSRTEYET